ncbi:hypothetical protein [Hydrotalea sp.]|uniref:hypothetical protein n=1 Tax=Hydrotalea sp. TaxID=2881279 RepID=UPI00260FD45B|nr:hypothetical protein [Hydrotalea sp.]
MAPIHYNIPQPAYLYYAVQAQTLKVAAVVFFILSIILVIIIYTNTYIEKRYFLLKKVTQKRMTDWLAEKITAIDESTVAVEIPERINKILKSNYAKKIIVDKLIALKNNLLGNEAANIISLYQALGLKNSSIKKLYSKKWYVKAKGIHELYTMDQRDLLKVIYKNANSKNELVRTEAQTGIVHMYGFDGLRFLGVISNPISAWQQIKLLAQLQNKQPDQVFFKKLNNWLEAKNDTVIIFCLKIAAIYKIEEVLPTIILKCLQHPNPTIRKTAIETMVAFPQKSETTILKARYSLETKQNKIVLLTAIKKIGSRHDTQFLKNIVLAEDIDLAREAMVTLLTITPEMKTWNEQILIQKSKVTKCTLHAIDALAYQ